MARFDVRLPAAPHRIRTLLRRPRKPRRASAPDVHPELGRRAHPVARAAGLVAVVLAGAWLGLLTVGVVRAPVGPMNTTMGLQPSLDGGTEIDIPPLGALSLDTHTAPFRLQVDVDQLDAERSRDLVDHPERISGLQDAVTEDVGDGILTLAIRSGAAVVVGATALGLIVYRRPRRALAAGGLAFALLGVSGATAWATWNPNSVLEPRFSGLLSSAPSVVGNARSIVSDFDVYQQELARLVTNVTKLYDATSTLPAYQPDPTTIRVLHVSDIHLNPASWEIIASLVEQYDIDVIVDSGDTMDHGTKAENRFLDPVPDLGAPYIWVRGNHDSRDTQEYISALDDVHVLDEGRAVDVAGLRFAGIGDPQFTPDRSRPQGGKAAAERAGVQLAAEIRDHRRAGKPVDVAVVHDPQAARKTDGVVPLVLSGHIHKQRTWTLKLGTRLRTEGSTGGGGLRALEGKKPDPIEASVLYFDRDNRRMQAWDEIRLGGLGLTTAEVSRHLVEENQPGAASPEPSGSPSGSPAAAPSTEPSPRRPGGER